MTYKAALNIRSLTTINSDKWTYVFILILLSLSAFLWSMNLLVEWGSDYGVYYANARYLSSNYVLYGEMFTHKGPLYYMFLRFLGGLYGWGVGQAVTSLFLTVLVFFITTVWVCIKFELTKERLLAIALLTIATLVNQGSNASISYFQATFMLLSFYYLVHSVRTINVWHTHLSLIWLLFAILVRIDALAFIALHVAVYVWHLHRLAEKTQVIRHMLTAAAIILASIVVPPILFKYDFSDFLKQNIEFNSYYRSLCYSGVKMILYRPESVQTLMTSGSMLFVIAIASNITVPKSRAARQVGTPICFQAWLVVAILGFSFLVWFASGSDKDYHILIVMPGMLLFIIYNINRHIKSRFLYVTLPYLLYMVFLVTAFGANVVMNNLSNGQLWDQESSNLADYRKTIRMLETTDSAYVIGCRGWLYVFSDTKPLIAINNWWLYWQEPGYETEGLIRAHRRLMNSVGCRYIVDEEILAKPTKYLQELLEKSYFLYFPDESKCYSVWEVAREKTIDYGNAANIFPEKGLMSESSRPTKAYE